MSKTSIMFRGLKKIVLGLTVVSMGLLSGLSANAAKKSSADEMNISNTGVLLKYVDTNEKKHKVVIPKTVEEIADEAFAGCDKITEIQFEKPENIKVIGKNAFSGCSSLKSFTVPKNIDVLGENMFNSCTALKKIKIHKNVKVIGDNCFSSCSSLQKIEFPKKLGIIGNSAFSNCIGLSKIKIPNTVLIIGEQAFSGCTNLKLSKGKLPADLIVLGKKAFQNCTSLDKVILFSNLGKYESKNGGLTGLGYDCFTGCIALKKVEFKETGRKPNLNENEYFSSEATVGLKELGAGLFSNCKKLKEVVIGNYFIETIDETIFNGCNGKITIKAPQWVIDKSIKAFVERYNQNNVTLQYKVK